MTTTIFYDIVKEHFPKNLYPVIRSFNPLKTKNHQEEYHEHCYNTGLNLDKIFKERYPNLYTKYSEKILGEYNILHVIGFFHDIGKPFAFRRFERAGKVFENMTGHAQLSAYLVRRVFQDKIDERLLDIIVYCIDKHMCRNYLYSVEVKKEYIPILNCLFYADCISRETCDESFFQEAREREIVLKNFKIIILPIGLQCCGKTKLCNDLKKQYDLIHIEEELETNFKNSIETALLSSINIIIIDTVMTLYRKSFEKVIESMSEEAIQAFNDSIKLGFYLFPQHQLQKVDFIKIYKTYPDDTITFPTVKGENETGFLDIGTGNYKNLLNTMDNLLKSFKQDNLIRLLKTMNLDDVIQKFAKPSVCFKEEFQNIFVVCYTDAFQTISGITKDIRGEVVLLKENTYHLLRGAFPVFSEISELKEEFFESGYDKVIATPKYDGSLVHITCIKKTDILYKDLLRLKNIRETKKAIYITGSKMNSINTDKIMLKKIKKTMSDVIDELDSSVIDKINYDRINFQFEVVSYESGTVCYDKPFYKLLSYVVYDDNHKKIKLPDSFISEKIDTVEQYPFKNVRELKDFIKERYTKLITGDNSIEPEGYVIYFEYKDDMILYKYKYPEYQVAHKPDINVKRTKEILSKMNENLRDRFIKFKNLKKYNDSKDIFFKEFAILKDILNKSEKETLYKQLCKNDSTINRLEKCIKEFNYGIHFKKMKNVNLKGFIMKNFESDDIEEKIREFYFVEELS